MLSHQRGLGLLGELPGDKRGRSRRCRLCPHYSLCRRGVYDLPGGGPHSKPISACTSANVGGEHGAVRATVAWPALTAAGMEEETTELDEEILRDLEALVSEASRPAPPVARDASSERAAKRGPSCVRPVGPGADGRAADRCVRRRAPWPISAPHADQLSSVDGKGQASGRACGETCVTFVCFAQPVWTWVDDGVCVNGHPPNPRESTLGVLAAHSCTYKLSVRQVTHSRMAVAAVPLLWCTPMQGRTPLDTQRLPSGCPARGSHHTRRGLGRMTGACGPGGGVQRLRR